MNLDDLDHFRKIDTHDMRAHIDGLPDQLESAWKVGQTLPLPDSFKRVERIVIGGMGGSAIGADLLSAMLAPSSRIPVIVNRGYDLPLFASGPETLVIASSYSGDTEETLSLLEQAIARGTQILSITTGGAVAARTQQAGGTLWTFDYQSQPRAALGWTLGLLVVCADRLGLAQGLSDNVTEAVKIMRDRVGILGIESPAVKNPAKRLAGQFVGRIPIIHGAGILAPVARRWKTQLNENAKSVAQFEEMPEMNHNTISGIDFPPPLMTKIAVVFLVAPRSDQPGQARVSLRFDMTRQLYLQQGIAPDTIKARGSSALAQMMSLIQFGDYVSYYAAMAYNVDPTSIPHIVELKEKLAAATH